MALGSVREIALGSGREIALGSGREITKEQEKQQR